MKEIHFCFKGFSSYVVRMIDNMIYTIIQEGDFLGLVDMVPDPDEFITKIDTEENVFWKFTV